MFEIKYGIYGAIERGGLDFVLESAKGVFELAEEVKVVSGIDRAKDTLERLKKWEEPGVDELKITKTGETVNGASKSGSGSKPYTNSRPSYGKNQVNEVWENAKDPITGKVYDPSGVEIHGIKLNREMVNGIWGIFLVRNTLKCINYIWMM